MLLGMAKLLAQRGTCERLRVGCVVSRDGRVLASGYNGPPAGLEHCSSKTCNPDAFCTYAAHAESNAIAFAAKYGTPLNGASLYCTHSPCMVCARMIINAGIIEVIYLEPFRDTAVPLNLLDLANVPHIRYLGALTQ